MNIPESIKNRIGGRKYIKDSVGMSASAVLCFDDMVLKTGVRENEVSMMKWLDGRLPVPKVLAYENGCLLMSKMGGAMLCGTEYMNNPKRLVKLLAEALHMLWEVDITACPCDMRLDKKLKMAEYRVENNLCSMEDAEPETFGKGGFADPEQLLRWLTDDKPPEAPVLSHGDFCLPNIFALGGEISGFVDFGKCGAADKYCDLALCYRSLMHNAGGKCTGTAVKNLNAPALFAELGITPDMERIKYYILLDELF